MVYKENFIVALKLDGRILREDSGNVYLPFGSEYTIYMKNVDTRDAVVKIWIDGEDVVGDRRIIVRANSTAELKGSKKDNRVKYRFKFIEKTQEISNYRGDKIDDGIIRVEVTYEKKIEYTYKQTINWNVPWTWPYNYYTPIDDRKWKTQSEPFIYFSGGDYNSGGDYSSGGDSNNYLMPLSCSAIDQKGTGCLGDAKCKSKCRAFSNDGITVKGSDVQQDFTGAHIGELETTSHVIIMKLNGYHENSKVEKPLMVRDKIQCETCGRKMKSSQKFCSNCGSRLT